MEFSHTVVKDTIRIDKIIDPREMVVIPEAIEEFPVTELGPYVLAESEAIELWLPSRLKKIGAYGFYNCEKLERIHISSRTTDLGAGLFAGASHVGFLDIMVFEGEKSNLKELLSELRQTLRVKLHLCEETGNGRYVKKAEARLIFPEYYEESVENTPARILYIETHGCGHRYRYCFAGTRFQYEGYDALFPHIMVQEKEELVTELALGRLKYPWGLSEKHKEMYEKYVREHWEIAGQLMIEADLQGERGNRNVEAGGIVWLAEKLLGRTSANGESLLPYARIQKLIQMAGHAGDTEAVSRLMDFWHHNQGEKKRRRFEL
ncbi:MAG: leucine-rich repeat protein [Lachnospiraceae bacterium]|jgi:hypothetical protein|nr:leucine-rich repeat protein [Lachnospiraceae bacterium]